MAEGAEKRQTAVWLDAWTDPVAGVSSFGSCVLTADLEGDGDWRLLIATPQKKLKVWRGTVLSREHALLDRPTSVQAFYSDAAKPALPALAVASGCHLFIYRNMRPYFKFTLPNIDLHPSEVETWQQLANQAIDSKPACMRLAQLRDEGTQLSARSIDLLQLEHESEREDFIVRTRGTPLTQSTVITCTSVVQQSSSEWDAISCVVLGTEQGQIIVLESSGTAIKLKKQLPAVPVFLAVAGVLDVEYRITVACRNGALYSIKNGELTGTVIELESQPVGLIRHPKNVVVGCMNSVVYSYHVKGKKNFSLHLPAPILCMEDLTIERQRMIKAAIVALANGEVRVYNEKHLVSVITMPDLVTGMRFGRFGREDNVLVCTTRSGALSVKILPRMANLEVSSAHTGPPPEQDIPLNVPKKTKLYVEQTQREREQAVDMHRIFQRDLCKLRLSTARAYVKVLTDGQGPISYTSGSSLRLNAQVQGLGPLFKIRMNLQNTGAKPITNVPIMISAAPIYALDRCQLHVPVLIPGMTHVSEVNVRCIDENGGADVVKVFVCSATSTVPILSAVVKMPLSEMVEGVNM